jgi:signal transduction histidine kinase
MNRPLIRAPKLDDDASARVPAADQHAPREMASRTRLAVLSIAGFWLVYFLLATGRAWIGDMPAQEAMLLRRTIVTVASMGLTFLLYRLLSRFEGARTGKLLTVAFLASVPLAFAYSVVNYIAFYQFPVHQMDLIDPMWVHKAPHVIIFSQALDWYFFIAAWAVMWTAILYAGKVQKAERAAAHYARMAQDAELRALRYQVNPHFLFNTLNSLSTLVMRGANHEAEAMILNLSNFFRASLTRDAADDLPLIEEVRLQQLYLGIEKVRFPERLRVEIDVPRELEQMPVPALILQPLVENAIKYGVSKSRRPVTVRIGARLSDSGRLVLDVGDDGEVVTLDDGSKPAGMGVGLRNVKARLAARHGDEARLVAGPGPMGGFLARIVMPAERRRAEVRAPAPARSDETLGESLLPLR